MPTASRSGSGRTPAPANEPAGEEGARDTGFDPGRDRLVRLELDENLGARRPPDIEQERTMAIADLLEENRFRLAGGPPGPYVLRLGVDSNRLVFDVANLDGERLRTFGLALGPFRRVVKDYFRVCESYYDAIKRLSPSMIEAIDMGRRALHNEGAELLRRRLDGKIEVDTDTGRRLFTLVCVLHVRS